MPPPPGSAESGWRNENECCLNMPPLPWPALDTGLYAFHGTLREEFFQILQLSGVCGHGLEPCTLSTQLILPRSTTQITSVYQFATAYHAPIIWISAQGLYGNYRITKRRSICRWVYLLWNRTSLTNLCHPL